jgi:hypothetical protein
MCVYLRARFLQVEHNHVLCSGVVFFTSRRVDDRGNLNGYLQTRLRIIGSRLLALGQNRLNPKCNWHQQSIYIPEIGHCEFPSSGVLAVRFLGKFSCSGSSRKKVPGGSALFATMIPGLFGVKISLIELTTVAVIVTLPLAAVVSGFRGGAAALINGTINSTTIAIDSAAPFTFWSVARSKRDECGGRGFSHFQKLF